MATVVEDIVEKIAGMTVLELSDLKKALEDKFDVTAAAPMMGMAMAAPAGEVVAEEKTSFDAILSEIGGAKLTPRKEAYLHAVRRPKGVQRSAGPS